MVTLLSAGGLDTISKNDLSGLLWGKGRIRALVALSVLVLAFMVHVVINLEIVNSFIIPQNVSNQPVIL